MYVLSSACDCVCIYIMLREESPLSIALSCKNTLLSGATRAPLREVLQAMHLSSSCYSVRRVSYLYRLEACISPTAEALRNGTLARVT